MAQHRESADCYATLCNLTALRKPNHKKGDMSAVHAYSEKPLCLSLVLNLKISHVLNSQE